MNELLSDSLPDMDLTWIVRHLEKGECILLLGSDVDVVGADGERHNLSRELAAHLAADMAEEFDSREGLPYVAQVYSGKSRRNKSFLKEVVSRFVRDYETSDSAECVFTKLAKLPFRLIITSRYDHTMDDYLRAAGKDPVVISWDIFRGGLPKIPRDSLTAHRPLVFYLAGDIEDPDTLIVTEDDILTLVNHTTTQSPGVPNRIKTEMGKSGHMALLVGFGMSQWYTRVILRELGMQEDPDDISFAFGEFESFKRTTDRQAAHFHQSKFNMQPVVGDIEGLMEKVVDRWEEGGATSPDPVGPGESTPRRAFISYCSEDREHAKRLYEVMAQKNIECFWDETEMRGGDFWEERLKQEVAEATAFVLLVSPRLHEKTESVVHTEARQAWARSLNKNVKFLFPVFIDGCKDPYDLLGDSDFPSLTHRPLVGDDDRLALVEEILSLQPSAATNP